MKRERCDGAAGAVNAFKGASTPIEPPNTLTDDEMRYWRDIIATRNYADWTRADLVHACNLAKVFWLIERTFKEIESDTDPKLFDRLEKFTRLSIAMSSKLQIHALATVGRAEDAVARNKAQRNAAHKLEGLSGFIKRPEALQ